MKKTTFTTLSMLTVLSVGCAADDTAETPTTPAPVAAEQIVAADKPVGVAFYGLTIIDCQDEATTCLEQHGDGCTARLTDCLTDVSLQIGKDRIADVGDTVKCGTDGLTCFSGVGELQAAVACQATVENCVIEKVDTLAKVKLPHTHRILDLAGSLIETAVDIVEPVVGTAVNVVGQTVDAAGEVVGKTVETTGKVVGKAVDATGKVVDTAVDATGKVIGTTAHVAGEVVEAAVSTVDTVAGTAIDAVGGVVDGVLDVAECSVVSSRCWRESRDFRTCQDAYRKCLKN